MSALSQERPSLPASSSAFALPILSRAASSDGLSPFMLLEKSSLMNPKLHHLSSEKKHPLASSFTRRRLSSSNGEESDDSRMCTSGSSSSSGNATPPQPDSTGSISDEDPTMKPVPISAPIPSTPPRNPSATSVEMVDHLPYKRRPSFPPKPPRILSLLAESRPEENELKSEAQFQRLVASYSDNPLVPKTPRAPSDRGRYPEEAGDEEFTREDTPSDDGENPDFAYPPPEPIVISRRGTPVHAYDDAYMGSPGGYASMDVDTVFSFGSPSLASANASNWRYTPPSTSSAVRSNKRKHDDRYDPYPAAKRRAVSPSVYMRGSPRVSLPIAIPIQIPSSSASPTCSSPVITQIPSYYHQSSYAIPRSGMGSPSMVSSPTMRATIGLAASPVLRPIPRSRREAEEREVDTTGEAVSSLNLDHDERV